MSELIGKVLLLSGASFMLIAAIGILRMPDLMMRMHAVTKAGALGTSLVLLSVAVNYWELAIASLALAGVAFIILTAPVAAHMIARAAYWIGVPLWKNTIMDELRGSNHLPLSRSEDSSSSDAPDV
jgi:multicomponent Na+:H+ antiporter subunit G